jgi:hypothetical protein
VRWAVAGPETPSSTPTDDGDPTPTDDGEPASPEDQLAAEEIVELFVTWLASGERIEETAAMIEGGEELLEAGTLAEAQATAFEPVANYSGVVESVRLTGEDRARVRYSILSQGHPVLTTDGEAVEVDGVWKVARATYCAAIAMGPTTCPPE